MSVTPLVYTTFYIGLECGNLAPVTSVSSAPPPHLSLTNKPPSDNQGPRKPHYHILFSTSYGLDRNQLEQLNHTIRNENPDHFNPEEERSKFFGCPTRKSQDFIVYTSDVSFAPINKMQVTEVSHNRIPLSPFPWLSMSQVKDQPLSLEKLESLS